MCSPTVFSAKLVLSPSSKDGIGVFATSHIRRGEFLAFYTGAYRVSKRAPTTRRARRYVVLWDDVLVDDAHAQLYVVPSDDDPAKSFNTDVCSRLNAECHSAVVDGCHVQRGAKDAKYACTVLFATRDIAIGEEVTWLYRNDPATMRLGADEGRVLTSRRAYSSATILQRWRKSAPCNRDKLLPRRCCGSPVVWHHALGKWVVVIKRPRERRRPEPEPSAERSVEHGVASGRRGCANGLALALDEVIGSISRLMA